MDFMVFSLPRSRSKWISEFLSYNGLICGHDLAAFARSIEDFRGLLGGVDGSCETGAVVGWKILRLEYPKARFAVVKRPLGEVVDSIRKKGFEPVVEILESRNEMLEILASAPRVKQFGFDDLNGLEACKELFEFTTGESFDIDWWNRLRVLNIQINFEERIRFLQLHETETRNLLQEVAMVNAKLRGVEGCLGLN